MKGKYKVLWNYYTEGYKFYAPDYDSVEEAVKGALESGYSTPFEIVKLIDWKATEISK